MSYYPFAPPKDSSGLQLPIRKPPDRKLMRLAKTLFRSGIYLAIVGIITSTLLVAPYRKTLGIVVLLIIVFILYVASLEILKKREHSLVTTPRSVIHSYIAVIGLSIAYFLFWNVGYGSGGEDPTFLWFLALVPLSLVSRDGKTIQWVVLLLITLVLLLSSRFAFAYKDLGQFWGEGLIQLAQLHPQLPNIRLPQTPYLTALVEASLVALISAGTHFAFRLQRTSNVRSDIALQVANRLAGSNYPEVDYTGAAEAIRSLDDFPQDYFQYVHIMLWDENEQLLKVVGGAGKPRSLWDGFAVAAGEGITGSVYQSGELRNIADVHKLLDTGEYRRVSGYEDVRAELAVPIEFQGRILGVLDVQSDRVGEFDEDDKKLLQILAHGVGISFANSLSLDKSVQSAFQLILATVNAGKEEVRLHSWFQRIAQAICQHTDANRLVFFRLAPGTRYPIKWVHIWPEVSNFDRTRYWPIPGESIFWKLLEDWKPVLGVNVPSPKREAEDPNIWIHKFLDATNSKAIAFLPIGTDEPLGVMFLLYSQHKQFGDIGRLALTTFATAVENSYRRVAPHRSEPRSWGSTVHEVMVPGTTLILGRLSRIETGKGDPQVVEELVELTRQDVRRLHERVILATYESSFDPYTGEMYKALHAQASHLKAAKPYKISFSIKGVRQIDLNEPPTLKDILYKIATEAMINSVEHGMASEVRVHFRREPDAIELEVIDNGNGLKKGHSRKRPHGIYYWRRVIKREFGEELYIKDRADGGVRVFVSLPTRPLSHYQG